MSEILQIPIHRTLSERARWLVALRWMVLTIAAALVIAANHWLGNVLLTLPLWLTLAAIALYNVAFRLLVGRLEQSNAPYRSYVHLMHLQVIVDLIALTLLLHLSGGLENPFSLFYVLIVVVGSTLMDRRASLGYALAASLLWICLLIAEANGLIPHYNLTGFRSPLRYQQTGHIVAESVVLLIGNLAAAQTVSAIIARLRQGERQLYQANASCELRADELASLNARLQDMDRTRSLFIRLVTHELRAPTAAIQSYLRLILEGYVPEERLMEIIGKAERRANDQLELIGDLLDLARVQTQPAQAADQPCCVCSVLTDVLDMMQARISDKQLTFRVPPQPGQPINVAVPEEHLRQVWINLISNAIKYTPAGGEVTISIGLNGNSVRCSVKDTGIGIAPEDQERIFETFYRTEAAKAMESRGTGLGLSIVKGIVERYGGRLWLDSKVGVGSTFSVELPLAQELKRAA